MFPEPCGMRADSVTFVQLARATWQVPEGSPIKKQSVAHCAKVSVVRGKVQDQVDMVYRYTCSYGHFRVSPKMPHNMSDCLYLLRPKVRPKVTWRFREKSPESPSRRYRFAQSIILRSPEMEILYNFRPSLTSSFHRMFPRMPAGNSARRGLERALKNRPRSNYMLLVLGCKRVG